MPDQGRSRDGGFTLLETIVVVLLVSVLASVIVAVVAVILKNVPTTEARADDSRSYQNLITWLPKDATSTEPNQFAIEGVPSSTGWGCSGVTVTALPLVRMSFAHHGTAYVTDYRVVDTAVGKRVRRYTCSGPTSPATPTFPVSGSRYVTSVVKDADAVPIKPGSEIVGVVIRLTTCATPKCADPGSIITVEGGSRNRDGPLP